MEDDQGSHCDQAERQTFTSEKLHGDEMVQYGLDIDSDWLDCVWSKKDTENVPRKYVTIDDDEFGES